MLRPRRKDGCGGVNTSAAWSWISRSGSRGRERSVVVAVISVRMMEMPVMQVVDVVAVRHRLVAAGRAVRVPLFVTRAAERWIASVRILIAHLDHVLVDMIALGMVQVPVVQVVDMVAMADSSMSAPRTVPMRMARMCSSGRGCHHGLRDLTAHASSERDPSLSAASRAWRPIPPIVARADACGSYEGPAHAAWPG
jgi:hypothetical protein